MPDHSGRMLADILAWPDIRLEFTHDFIQWLFPMRVPSPVNPAAPTVDDATVKEFAADPALREALAASFLRMVTFYGFEVRQSGPSITICRSAEWPDRSKNWLVPRNHNMLRITRILTSLRLLGLGDYAVALFEVLTDVYDSDEGSAIGPVAFEFWTAAMHDTP
jgi:hypothetical protein